MKRVAIIGLGLMGGSLGLALRRAGLAEVSAYARRAETRALALAEGAADTVHETPQAALKGASVVVFCTPVCRIPDLVRECLKAFEPGCVVTDVGSTKAELARAMAILFDGRPLAFVGSHPMAGSEKTGMEAARADLYDDAVTAVTPYGGTAPEAIRAVTDLWESVGARVMVLDAESHDALVARTSHLPHLVAALLVATAGRDPRGAVKAFCGPGFRDTTRVASGSPDMWHDIVRTNREPILAELKAHEHQTRGLIAAIEHEDYESVRALLDRSRALRHELLGGI
jgi:prephenate dehydrogenase